MDLIKVAEEAFATGKKFPEFKAGHGKVRRAKLYYLRKLTGKKARIAEKKTIAKSAE